MHPSISLETLSAELAFLLKTETTLYEAADKAKAKDPPSLPVPTIAIFDFFCKFHHVFPNLNRFDVMENTKTHYIDKFDSAHHHILDWLPGNCTRKSYFTNRIFAKI